MADELDAVRLSLPLPYLRQVAVQVKALGVDVPAWLGRSGLGPEDLDEGMRDLPFSMFQKLVVDAMALSNEPALGLLVGQRLKLPTHGVLGVAAQSSGTIGEAIGLLPSFTRTRFSLVSVAIEEGRDVVRVRVTPSRVLGAIERPVLEAVILGTKNILDAVSLGACRFDVVAFSPEAPPYVALARQVFGCAVRYGEAWSGFAVPREALTIPLREADPAAFREAVRLCEIDLDKLNASETEAGRVRRLLLEHPQGFPSLELAARLLRTTPRTLHRRLVAEGTSFREVLEDVRRRLALEHLKLGRLGLEEIAYTLGYTDVANFRRAFRRWEGKPPSAHRDYRKRSS